MNPIMIDFPEEFDKERLVIRMPKPGDKTHKFVGFYFFIGMNY